MKKILKLEKNVNTDQIIPAKRCTTFDKKELAKFAFEHILGANGLINRRYTEIEAGENFGCGSSREHAPLSLLGAGIETITADSFAEIFYRNAINIGLRLKHACESEVPEIIELIKSFGGLAQFNIARLSSRISLPKNNTNSREMTIAEMIIARASCNRYVKPGDVVFATPDLVMSHDAVVAAAVRTFEEEYGEDAKVLDPKKFVFVGDHFIQLNDDNAKKLYEDMLSFAKKHGIFTYKKIGNDEAQGICHVLLPEDGFIYPGQFIVGTDSHSCTYGAFGAFSMGIGTTDLAHLFAIGDIWLRVPGTYRIEINGKLKSDVTAKDVMFYILRNIGSSGAQGKVIEFGGSLVESMPLDELMTLSNMAVEAGALCGLIVPNHLSQGKYAQTGVLDISELTPLVAKPYSPDNVIELGNLPKTKVDVCYIGSCTGGKLEDLANAAGVLDGKKVAGGVKLYIAPATQMIKEKAERFGYMKIFRKAGATILPVGCGACINAGAGALGPNEIGVFATNRNFEGRNGDLSSKVYLASPITVARAAILGYLGGS